MNSIHADALPASPRNAGGVVLVVGALLLVPLLALVATAMYTIDAPALAHLARTVLAETVMVSTILAAGTLFGTVRIGLMCLHACRYRTSVLQST